MAYTYNNIIINYVILFILIFEAVGFLFERKYNNITDYNDPKYTGGIEYIFNPLGLLTGV